jgi:hypothetical protein
MEDDDLIVDVDVAPPAVSGMGFFPEPPSVWVVLLYGPRDCDEATVYEVLDEDPGKNYPDRLQAALRLTRNPLAGSYVSVSKHVPRAVPR